MRKQKGGDAPVIIKGPELKALGVPSGTVQSWLRSGVLRPTDCPGIYEETPETRVRIARYLENKPAVSAATTAPAAPAPPPVQPAKPAPDTPRAKARIAELEAELAEALAWLSPALAAVSKLYEDVEVAFALSEELEERAALMEKKLRAAGGAPVKESDLQAECAAWKDIAIYYAVKATSAKPPSTLANQARAARKTLRGLGIDSETGRRLDS
jgi:hypothetical protein